MRIRLAVPADIPVLFDIRTGVRENHMSLEELAAVDITPESIAVMLHGEGRGWVMEDRGTLAAFAMANAAEATIFAMFVRPEFEARGCGRRLMNAAEQWLFAQGCNSIWLRTAPDQRIRANGFYQRLGWTNQGVQEDGQNEYTKCASAEGRIEIPASDIAGACDSGIETTGYSTSEDHRAQVKDTTVSRSFQCLCGTVQIALDGEAVARANCHCQTCRDFYNTPMLSATAWIPKQVTIEKGKLVTFSHPTKQLSRAFCVRCGETMFGTNRMGLRVVPNSLIARTEDDELPEKFRPTMHLFYSSRVIDVKDDLLKYLEGWDGPTLASS